MRWTLRRKMLALIIGPTLVIYILILGAMLEYLSKENLRQVENETTQLAVNYAARFDDALVTAASVADANARFLEIDPDVSEEQLYLMLERSVERLEYIYGGAIAFEPGTYFNDDRLFSPYVYRSDDELVRIDINESVYDWYNDPQWEWYRRPRDERRPIWTDVYFDEGAGNVLMVTYSAPFFRDGEVRGVATVDLELPVLRDTIGEEIVGDHNFYVLTSDGTFVYSSTPGETGGNIFEIAEQSDRPDIAEIARHVIGGEIGTQIVDGVKGIDTPGARYLVFYAPIRSTQWGFASEVLESEALAPAYRRLVIAGIALALTMLLIIASVFFVSGRLVRPIVALREQAGRIAGGDLDAKVDVESKDEIGDLATAFNTMTSELRSHVQRLAHEQAERQKIERDLDLAREIQRGLLPKDLPNMPGFDVAGWNQPADQTGGDYFDWMSLPDGKTIFVLADVTGHGIGPALIVSVCRAYLRAASQSKDVSLSGALRRVNSLLIQDIPSTHFVTAAVAIVDPSNAEMAFLSAGQAPVIYYRAATDEVLATDADHPPLAVVDDLDFPEPREYRWELGDMLVLTTDGFFEWANADGELYGTKRLADFVGANHHLDAEAFIQALYEDVRRFSGGTPQNDDLTALVIKRIERPSA